MAIHRYVILAGLRGCYMPDSVMPAKYSRRRDLVQDVKSEIERMDWPASLIRTVPFRALWNKAKHHGMPLDFAIYHKGYGIEFSGISKADYDERVKNEGEY